MKTVFLILAISIASTFGFANTTFAQSSGNTFQVTNQSTQDLGLVTVTAPSGNYNLNVPAQSQESITIPDTAMSVTINGQTVPVGPKVVVQLQSGKFVIVMSPAPNMIVVIDQNELG
jgi:hypothetical protein